MTGLELLPLVGIVLLFWLLILRPTQRRAKEQYRMQSQLAVGDEVLLTSGFIATITELLDDRVEVQLSPTTTVTVVRGAVGSVIAPEPDADLAYDDPNETDVEAPERRDAEES